MGNRLIAAAALLVVLVLTACSAITTGTITAKHHREGYYYPVTYCAMYDSKGLCKMWLTRQDYAPPTWRFDLSQAGTGMNDDRGKTGFVYVNEQTYNEYEVGDHFGEE